MERFKEKPREVVACFEQCVKTLTHCTCASVDFGNGVKIVRRDNEWCKGAARFFVIIDGVAVRKGSSHNGGPTLCAAYHRAGRDSTL